MQTENVSTFYAMYSFNSITSSTVNSLNFVEIL